MLKPPESPNPPPKPASRPPKNEGPESDGWKSSAQTQRLLHELQVHQIELEMQNEELRVSRAEVEAGLNRYTDLYDFAPIGYLTLSAEGALRALNLPAARLLGRERSRLIGTRLRTFVSEAARSAFEAWLVSVFAGIEERTCEVVLLRDNLPPVHAQLEAKLSLDGQTARVVLIDISSRKFLEDELREAQKMEVIGHLAGGVADDFNDILAAMRLNLGTLRRLAESPQEACAALDSLDDLARRAASLTSQLLSFGQRQVLQQQRLELNAAISRWFEPLEGLLGAEINCVFQASAAELWLQADLHCLEQVVMSLCLNARDAMPNGGALTLETSLVEFDTTSMHMNPKARPGSFVCLSVADTGKGMTADALERVFEPFFTPEGLAKGSGLGLASVYGTVQQHQGWLDVESWPGRGSTFRLYLPQSGCARTVETAPRAKP